MIAKGTTHNSGGRLAVYMITGKNGERAELWQLRGFASDDIKQAFRSVHVMAEATRCEKPFFHVQVRNPEGEHLTREQWERVANRIESKIGFSGQPRAIAFHRSEKTGDEHMHIAWSRIDEETLTARNPDFFKWRLKGVSRELEIELSLTQVKNERDTPVRAPTRNEIEQARRLGIDIHEVRKTIRNCWEHSDSGRGFAAALADERLTLAQGDRRDFVVLDREGGMHALGKRVLGTTAAETRARMSDIDRATIPTLETAREQIRVTRQHPAICAIAAEAIPAPKPPREIDETTSDIGASYGMRRNTEFFSQALSDRGIHLAAVTHKEAKQNKAARAVGKESYQAREIVALNPAGQFYQLDDHTTKENRRPELDKSLGVLDRSQLQVIEATQQEITLQTEQIIAPSQGKGVAHLAGQAYDAVAELARKGVAAVEEKLDWQRYLDDRDHRGRLTRSRNASDRGGNRNATEARAESVATRAAETDESRVACETPRPEPPKRTHCTHSFRQAYRQATTRNRIPKPVRVKKRRRGDAGSAGGFRMAGRHLSHRVPHRLATVTKPAKRLSDAPCIPPLSLPPSHDWNVVQWLDNWRQAEPVQENVAPLGLPERPPTMGELYEFFKAKGEIEYFFAEICHDPEALLYG